MLILLCVAIVTAGFLTAYVVSLYSLAVYIDPEEVDTLLAGASRRKREFLRKLADDPRAFVQIAAVYKAFVLILNTGVITLVLSQSTASFGGSDKIVIPVALLIVWLLHIAVVEYFPRRSSRKAINDQMTRYLWLISLLYRIFFPIVLLYRRALRKVKVENEITEEEKEEIVERAIETLAEQAGISEAIIEADEKEMIGHIFLLDQTVVREIMSPRIDITAIEVSEVFVKIQEIIRQDGHSRYPVYQESIDKIIGILYVKDLFNKMPKPGEEFVMSRYLRKPFFVPESKVIGDLLREFRIKKLHIAVVVDEYGGISGLVTLEDILEEIVGEIQDEYDSEEAMFKKLADGKYLVDAALPVDELQRNLDIDYEQEDNDTVGGLIYDLVGSVPEEGSKVKWYGIEFEIIRCEGQRIKKVRVLRKP